jgi:tetratricopeptide (TPR) repeat protein
MPIGKKAQKHLNRLMAAAQRLVAQGQHQQAVETAVKALETDESCLPAYLLIARVQLQHRNDEPARWAIGEALKLAPESAAVLFDSARLHRGLGELATALAHAERALEIDPGLPDAEGFVIHLLTLLGRDDEARRRLEAAFDARPRDIGVGLVFADWAVRIGRAADAIQRLEACLNTMQCPPGIRRDVLFRLAPLYEHRGDYDRAFAAAHEAQRLLPRSWNPAAYDGAVNDVCFNWSAEFLARARRARNEAGPLIFIVGMPRSGTSLVEQILASHPAVAAGGELPHLPASALAAAGPSADLIPFQRNLGILTESVVTQIGAGYLEAIAGRAAGKARLTDKMPANHAMLGLIELALPGARIVHCRRDARDTCLSCYFTPLWEGLRYAGDLAHLGRYARAEQRLMAHWKARLSLPILTMDYADLVANTEPQARRLIDFAGLDWHPDCLRFYESRRFVNTASAMQVRQPVYTSSLGRWRRYERHLTPLLQALGAQY